MKTRLVILLFLTIIVSVFSEGYDDDEDADMYDEDLPPKVAVITHKPVPVGTVYNIQDAPQLFEKFIKDFNKQYKDDEEYQRRYGNFVKTLKNINEVNSMKRSFVSDINSFADWDEAERAVLASADELLW